jgi:hypothetical protein
MVILTPITINNHFNNANYVTKVDHLCSERHTFNFLLKKVDFRGEQTAKFDKFEIVCYNKKFLILIIIPYKKYNRRVMSF